MIPPIVAPFVPAPPAPSRFVKRGFYMCCCTCGLTIDYCKGHAPPDTQSADGAETSLSKRVAEVLAQRGTGGR